jgi:hypothetical protein
MYRGGEGTAGLRLIVRRPMFLYGNTQDALVTVQMQ